jgi:hypothetical protein
MTLYSFLPVGPFVESTLDLSQIASLVNRRFYRQGLNWAVAGFKIISDAGAGEVTVSKLPNTWVLSNSWEKSFRVWQRMNREAMEENESVRPRFLDFKIYADATHHEAGFAGNLLPFSSAGAYEYGEWESSKIFYPNTATAGAVGNVETEIIGVGQNYPGVSTVTGHNAVSMIEGYAASRSLPQVTDPNTPSDVDDADGSTPENWMTAIFNDGTNQYAEVLDVLTDENNQSPYPFENGIDIRPNLPDGSVNPNFGQPYTDTMYPGGANQGPGLQVHDITNITNTTVGGVTRLKGGNFPCGLVRFTVTNVAELGSALLLIDLVPGNHRGYLCEPMTEM